MGMGGAAGGLDVLLRRLRAAQPEVLRDGTVEERGVLGDDCDMCRDTSGVDATEILAGVQLYMLAPLLTPSKGVWRRAATKAAEITA